QSLAAEAGLEVPKGTPREVEAERRRVDLHGVLELAQAGFVRRLRQEEGAAALAYLRGRGLSEATIARFGLGWSGDGRGKLLAELRAAGAETNTALEAGLLREAEDGAARELYWGRITFPIRDRRGRLISFGGRALGDTKPKYINGPDTPVFHKRRTLYALDLAREGVRAGQRLVLVEGYMDVIALHQAGFGGAVAPLGTALTEDQLAELWRISPEPVLCFDGDAAGARAAERAINLALPQLTPGYSLRIATLPPGEDPDSLVRTGGARAFATVLDGAVPLVDALFAALSRGMGEGPEQLAALRSRLEAAASSIPDRTLAYEYKAALRDRFFAARRRGGAKPARRVVRREVHPESTQAERARLLTGILLRHPALLRDVEEAYAALELPAELAGLREQILGVADHNMLDSGTLLAHLQHSGTAEDAARVLSAAMPLAASARPTAMPAEAEAEWWHIFGLMHRTRLEAEVDAARRAFAASPDQASQRRLIALCTALGALPVPDGDAET
ncbi:MAG TPA: toprim domain-containing protein, partial [Acetobacteraceae bacterium]|nr:toprim domain-containing protein [Acetobacteraceae bacterium]